MKYIHRRSKYSKINELVDSDKMNPEFGQTLIGGTLHRLLGFVRSAKKSNTLTAYSKQLDRLLASMLMKKAFSDIDEGEDSVTDDQKILNIKKIVVSQILLNAGKLYLDGQEEQAKIELQKVPSKLISYMPESAQEMVKELMVISTDEPEKSDNEVDVSNKQEIEKKDSEGSYTNITKQKDKTELIIDVSKSDISDEYKRKIESFYKILNENLRTKNNLMKMYLMCRNDISESNRKRIESILDTLAHRINRIDEDIKQALSSEPDNDSLLTLFKDIKIELNEEKVALNTLSKLLNNCKRPSDKEEDDTVKLLESIEYILEKNTATKNLTQKEFNRVRKDIEKASKDWDVDKEKLEKINKIAEEKAIDVTKITAREGKELMAILNKAKNALLHTKPYDEIRKNQKRWFDKLGNTERAVNRKGYQNWVKKVTEIISYYKGQIPDEVLTVISDSLDKDNIANDYVNLTKEFLGINIRGSRPSDNIGRHRRESENYVTGYEVGDIVEYGLSRGGSNKGEVISIGENDVTIKTKKGKFIILKKRIESVEKKK